MRLLVLAALLGTSTPALAEGGCKVPVSAAELARHISKADVAFAKMDAKAFRAARWQADKSIPCLGEAVQAGQVAAFYRMQALGSFMDQDHARTVAWFKSVFAVAPQYVLPATLAPDGHPLRIDFEVAQGSPRLRGEPIRRPAIGTIRVDGKAAIALPQDRPYLWQHIDQGGIRTTAVVQPGMAPPRYATVRGYQTLPRKSRSSGAMRIRRSPSPRVSIPLAAVAGCSAIASGFGRPDGPESTAPLRGRTFGGRRPHGAASERKAGSRQSNAMRALKAPP